MALAGDFNEVIRPELRDDFELDKANWFILNNYDKRTPYYLRLSLQVLVL